MCQVLLYSISYNIINKPNEPAPCETPDDKNKTKDDPGKTIVKLYVDIWKDANNSSQYTAARDYGTYTRTGCSSDIVISNERDKNGGYEVYAWYTSGTGTTSNAYKGSQMIKKTDWTQDTTLGSKLFKIGGYNSVTGVPNLSNKGTKAWVKKAGGNISTTSGSKQYTRNDKIPATGDIKRIKKADKQYISLTDDEKTLVILYVREHGSIDSSDGTPSSGTDTSLNNDPYRELKIVKCYGVINPITYEVVNDKSTVYWESKTRNVHIKPESGYRLAEYVYCTRGSNPSSMTAAKWCTVGSNKDKSFYLKGFVDGFSSAGSGLGSGTYSNQYVWTEKALDSTTSGNTITGNTDYPGTKGIGRLSGKQLKDYDKTIYFGPSLMNDTGNTSTSDDVLYILFIKDDIVTYETGTFGIPESYLTRWNNFATNNIKVTSKNGGTTAEYCQKPTIYITSK